MTEPQQLFIGLKISMAGLGEVQARAASLAEALATSEFPQVRWVAPARYHITLKFLDWVQPESFYAIRSAVAEVLRGVREVRFRPAGLGGFPSLAKARVLWLGVVEPEPLAELATRVEKALVPLGFPVEERPFQPHITLGRANPKRGEPKVGDLSSFAVESGSEQTYSQTTCRSVYLFESAEHSGSSEYAVKWEWPLRGGTDRSMS